MNAESSPVEYPDRDDAVLVAAPDDNWRAKACRGCGQRPDDLARLEAIAVIAFLQRRFASLLDNPEHTLRHRGPGRGSWSAMEPAAQVSNVLGVADSRLRDMLGEESLKPLPATETARLVTSPQTLSVVVSSLAENVRRLTATIAGATAADWRRPGPDGGASPGEMVWLALHDATHNLEDAELLLDAASATDLRPVQLSWGPTVP